MIPPLPISSDVWRGIITRGLISFILPRLVVLIFPSLLSPERTTMVTSIPSTRHLGELEQRVFAPSSARVGSLRTLSLHKFTLVPPPSVWGVLFCLPLRWGGFFLFFLSGWGYVALPVGGECGKLLKGGSGRRVPAWLRFPWGD